METDKQRNEMIQDIKKQQRIITIEDKQEDVKYILEKIEDRISELEDITDELTNAVKSLRGDIDE